MDILLSSKTVVLYDNVLTGDSNKALYESTISNDNKFQNTTTSTNAKDWRKSKVIFEKDFEAFNNLLKIIILSEYKEVINCLKIAPFEIDKIEIQLTSHNNGEYYKWHTDNGSDVSKKRIVTFVYYFHCQPKQFIGGELVLADQNKNEILISPSNNTMVFFNASNNHQVKPVICPSMDFKHGRFTLNGWIHCK